MAATIALGTLAFDGGSTAAPVTGAVITATSGATGVVYVVTVSTGAWGDNNVTGTITLGSCTGLFNDNEAVTWTGGLCTVNHPDGSVGADKHIKNGAFVTDNDPPNDWTAANSATLTTEGSGQVGNCIMITGNGTDDPYARQSAVGILTVGKNYKFSYFLKQGTEATSRVRIYDGTTWFNVDEEATASWVGHSYIFKATNTTKLIDLSQISSAGAGTTIYYDEVSLYLLGSGGGGNHYMFMDMKL